jgi:hypothetical protein
MDQGQRGFWGAGEAGEVRKGILNKWSPSPRWRPFLLGNNWQAKVKRQRVKVRTHDADVMKAWKDSTIIIAGKPFAEQIRFFEWINDNEDFRVMVERVKSGRKIEYED